MTANDLPPRIAARPNPNDWGEDDLMTLAEAAALFWPDGPISERTLRTAVRDGRLPISVLAGKFFVTKVALRRLSECEPIADGTATRAGSRSVLDDDLAAIDRMGRRER